MRCIRLILVVLTVLAANVAGAAAFTAPTLTAPAPGASYVSNDSVVFSWSGALQGDATALDRSFFRIEVAPTVEVPAGQNTSWSTLTNYVMTTPGVSQTSAPLGAPDAGAYSWRVCAWGVADATQSNSITSLACSAASTIATTAGSSNSSTSQSHMTQVSTKAGSVTHKTVTTGSKSTPATAVRTITRAGSVSTTTPTARVDLGKSASNAPSAVGLSDRTVGDAQSSIGSHLNSFGGTVADGLSWKLPVVPIPFWVVLLLSAAIPFVWWWRRTTLRMFDSYSDRAWSDDRGDRWADAGDYVPPGDRAENSDNNQPDEGAPGDSGRFAA